MLDVSAPGYRRQPLCCSNALLADNLKACVHDSLKARFRMLLDAFCVDNDHSWNATLFAE